MTTTSRALSVFPALSLAGARAGTARTAGILSLLLAGIASAHAADDDDEDFSAIMRKEKDPHHVNDWRLGYSMLPAGADISIMDSGNNANPANYERETNWDLTGRTGLMWMTPWSGMSEDGDFILGLELSTNHCVIESSASSPEIDMRSYQLTLHPGLGWLLDDNFHVEINPYLGVGHARRRATRRLDRGVATRRRGAPERRCRPLWCRCRAHRLRRRGRPHHGL